MQVLTELKNLTIIPIDGSGGIEKSHSCKWAKWIQWHALPHIQQSTQQRNKGYYPNLHGWDFSIPPSPYWFTNQVSYNTATIILNNKRNFNGFLTGLARWFQPHPIQQRLKIHPLKFLSWCDFALQILRNIKKLLIKSCSQGLRK